MPLSAAARRRLAITLRVATTVRMSTSPTTRAAIVTVPNVNPRETTHIVEKPAKPMIKLSAHAGRTHPARPDIRPRAPQIPINTADRPRPNPAISRLSASPTPGNVPHYSNAPRGVRETYIRAVIGRVRSNVVFRADILS